MNCLMPHTALMSCLISTVFFVSATVLQADDPEQTRTKDSSQRATGKSEPPHDIIDAAANYQDLQRMTLNGILVSDIAATRCMGATAKEINNAIENHGAHAESRINVHMNDIAAKAFRADRKHYPIGSVIVKEKIRLSGDDVRPNGVGGMVKRSPGYDPEHGDWEYFYAEKDTDVEWGRIENCVDCHKKTAKTDFVFGHDHWYATAQRDAKSPWGYGQ